MMQGIEPMHAEHRTYTCVKHACKDPNQSFSWDDSQPLFVHAGAEPSVIQPLDQSLNHCGVMGEYDLANHHLQPPPCHHFLALDSPNNQYAFVNVPNRPPSIVAAGAAPFRSTTHKMLCFACRTSERFP